MSHARRRAPRQEPSTPMQDSHAVGRPFDVTPDGVRLRGRLTPGASRTGLDGLIELPGGRLALRLRVQAPPVEGAANAAVIAYLAKTLKLSKSSVRIASGQSSRLKTIAIYGDSRDVAARLTAWIEAPVDA